MNRTSARIAGLCLVVLMSITDILGQTSPFAATTRRANFKRQDAPEIVRTRNVTLRAATLGLDQRTITLPLFDGITITAVRERTTRTKWGTLWTGRTREAGGVVLIAQRRGTYAIEVRPGGKARNTIYQIRHIGEGVHQIREIDTRKYPDEGKGREIREEKPRPKPQGDTDDCTTDPPEEIDVMIVYTDDARAAALGTDEIELEALLAVELSNVAYFNSDITQRLNLVQLMEVDYAEQDDENADLANLEGKADGQIDDIHAARDAAGADVVSMLVSKLNGWAGWANVMGTVSADFEDNAFSLVKWSSAVGNLSFPHELGHNMGARHDWPTDGTNNSPYAYNHGEFNLAPSSGGPWRTIMSYSNDLNGCDGVGECQRLPYFSNPNLNEPVSGDPLGSSTGSQTDNHLALNNTALTVANFRCSAPSVTNVWMKDTWNDTGAEPDPATASEDMWKSPYIWVRTAQDTTLTAQHMHENPNASANVFAYVKIHNGGNTTENGTLELYFANADVSLDWSSAWTQIDAIPVTSFAAHTTRVIEFPWTTPASGGHYCLVARWVSLNDPMATAETTDINANVRANNNLVWRNLNVLGGGDMDGAFWMSNRSRTARMRSTLAFRAPRGKRNFLTEGRMLVMLDNELLKIWKSGGGRMRGLKKEGNLFVVTHETAVFENMVLPPSTRARVFVKFEKTKKTNTTYVVDAVHLRDGSKVVGGVSYEIHTDKGFKQGTTVQQ